MCLTLAFKLANVISSNWIRLVFPQSRGCLLMRTLLIRNVEPKTQKFWWRLQSSYLSIFRRMERRLKCLTPPPRSPSCPPTPTSSKQTTVAFILIDVQYYRCHHLGSWATWSFTTRAPSTPALRCLCKKSYTVVNLRELWPWILWKFSHQVASPTLKGKHCLLTSFAKGAGVMEGFKGQYIDSIHPVRNVNDMDWSDLLTERCEGGRGRWW